MSRVKLVVGLLKKSPKEGVKRIASALGRRIKAKRQINKDLRAATFYTNPAVGIVPLFKEVNFNVSDNPAILNYIAHKFDLLGSGWVRNHYGMQALGVEGHVYTMQPQGGFDLKKLINAENLKESQEIWALIDQPDYQPIDWQLDFKSGYRWSGKDHVSKVLYAHKGGVDIKVPWELSRLQHLPQLALAGYKQEVRSQILDFIALNPPRFGVNWRCPMDVGIRIVNIVMAYSLLTGWDRPFERVLANSLQAHADHILAHLEWSEEARGNHYFANILGLLFAAHVLEKTERNKAMLGFAIQEFFLEAERQFLEDGTSFEGSTGYHRLSAEMLYWGCALIMGLNGGVVDYNPKALSIRPPFQAKAFEVKNDRVVIPPYVVQCCYRSACFIEDTTLPDGTSVKLGDYDSGRLLKLVPRFDQGVEVITDHRAAVRLSYALFGRGDDVEGKVISALAKGRTLNYDVNLSFKLFDHTHELMPTDQIKQQIDVTVPDDVTFTTYPDFGLYIWRGTGFLMTLRCHGGEGLREWGHFHDDNFALTLYGNGRNLIVDPGTYLYTAAPQERKKYRDVKAHFAPRLEECPAVTYGSSLFEAHPLAKGRCLKADEKNFLGVLVGANWQLARNIKITSKGITITDMSLSDGKKLLRDNFEASLLDTDGYGKKSKRPVYSV